MGWVSNRATDAGLTVAIAANSDQVLSWGAVSHNGARGLVAWPRWKCLDPDGSDRSGDAFRATEAPMVCQG